MRYSSTFIVSRRGTPMISENLRQNYLVIKQKNPFSINVNTNSSDKLDTIATFWYIYIYIYICVCVCVCVCLCVSVCVYNIISFILYIYNKIYSCNTDIVYENIHNSLFFFPIFFDYHFSFRAFNSFFKRKGLLTPRVCCVDSWILSTKWSEARIDAYKS